MRTSKTKANPDVAPASQTRVKAAPSRPEPARETLPDFEASADAARLADELDILRVKQAEFVMLEAELLPRLIDAIKRSGKKNFGTLHGRVSLLDATPSRSVIDEDAAVALLASHGISQPPTLEAWVVQNHLVVPMKDKPGLKDRIKFEMNK